MIVPKAYESLARLGASSLLRVIPAEYLLNAHHWLLLHGRYVCKARKPECPRCPLADLCAFEDKTLPPATALPLAKPGKPSPAARGSH